MSGVEQIDFERKRQLAKGWDDTINSDCQLAECASHILGDYMQDVADGSGSNDWPISRATKVMQKYKRDYIARLRIAGALIAAEIDRLEAEESAQASDET